MMKSVGVDRSGQQSEWKEIGFGTHQTEVRRCLFYSADRAAQQAQDQPQKSVALTLKNLASADKLQTATRLFEGTGSNKGSFKAEIQPYRSASVPLATVRWRPQQANASSQESLRFEVPSLGIDRQSPNLHRALQQPLPHEKTASPTMAPSVAPAMVLSPSHDLAKPKTLAEWKKSPALTGLPINPNLADKNKVYTATALHDELSIMAMPLHTLDALNNLAQLAGRPKFDRS